MALTTIDICNHALLKVGADTIASLDVNQAQDQGTLESAKLCNIFFDQALEETLRMYPWNSATKRAKLSRLSDAPVFKYAYAYQLPNDCVRVIDIYNSKEAYPSSCSWVIEGRQVLTNEETVYLKYVGVPENVQHLDPLAVQALICRLGIKLSVPLQLDNDVANNLISELEQVIMPSARSIDTIENRDWSDEPSNWMSTRYYDSPIT